MAVNPDAPKKSRGWLWVLLGTVAVVLLGFTSISRVYFHDEPPPDDADLRVRDPIVPAEQNGLVQLRKLPTDPVDFIKFAASTGMDEDEAQKVRDGHSANDALEDEFLAQAQPAFVKLDDVLQLPQFAYNDEISLNGEFPEIRIVPDYARALRISARRHQALGDYPAAVRDVIRLHLLARRLIAGHSTMLVVLTACTVNAINRRVIQQLLDDPALPPASELALAQELARDISWTGGLQRALDYEYLELVKLLEIAAQGRTVNSPSADAPGLDNPFLQSLIKSIIKFGLKVDATKQAAADFYRRVRQALDGPYSKANEMTFTAVWDYIGYGDKVNFWIRPNLIGRELLETPMQSLKSVMGTIYINVAEDRLLQTDAALRHYLDDHQALPGKLADLVPNYLREVPLDPFNNQPLHYDATRRLLYSVGTSLKDSGGSGFLKMSKDDLHYEDPLNDKTQPTLKVEFQNLPAMKTPEVKPAN